MIIQIMNTRSPARSHGASGRRLELKQDPPNLRLRYSCFANSSDRDHLDRHSSISCVRCHGLIRGSSDTILYAAVGYLSHNSLTSRYFGGTGFSGLHFTKHVCLTCTITGLSIRKSLITR